MEKTVNVTYKIQCVDFNKLFKLREIYLSDECKGTEMSC